MLFLSKDHTFHQTSLLSFMHVVCSPHKINQMGLDKWRKHKCHKYRIKIKTQTVLESNIYSVGAKLKMQLMI